MSLNENPALQQLKNTMRQILAAQNPQAALNQMLLNNPQTANLIQLIKDNGGDPKAAFFNYANQLGVNPQQILNYLL